MRVFTVSRADATSVHLYGCGVYEGDFPHPYIDPMTQEEVRTMLKRSGMEDNNSNLEQAMLQVNLFLGTNPRILLDNGQIIWGCECWWGPEDEMAVFINGRTVLPEDIDADRATYGKKPRAPVRGEACD